MELLKKLDSIKQQQEQARELFVKCQGAIELLEGLIKEQESSKNKTKDKDDLEKNKN